jgi:hypothetical protein
LIRQTPRYAVSRISTGGSRRDVEMELELELELELKRKAHPHYFMSSLSCSFVFVAALFAGTLFYLKPKVCRRPDLSLLAKTDSAIKSAPEDQ